MIETLRTFPVSDINKLYIVSFTTSNFESILPMYKDKIEFIKVPNIFMSPFLFKTLFFIIYTWFVSKTKLPARTKKIGIGIASLCSDFVNIQFVHHEWDHYYFKNIQLKFIPYIYKKILFSMYNFFEKVLYQYNTNTKFSILSSFEYKYIHEQFKVPKDNLLLNYSGINMDKFNFNATEEKSVTFEGLKRDYPQLSAIDISRPIYLFVGAFERKGLSFAISALSKLNNYQLIIIGKPESHNSKLISNPNIVYIDFTQEIEKFYQLCDNFIFPTIYEPFGLVLIEAASMGLRIYSTRNKVGSTELLEGLPEVYISETPESLRVTELKEVLSSTERLKIIKERSKKLALMNWEDTGARFWNFISKD